MCGHSGLGPYVTCRLMPQPQSPRTQIALPRVIAIYESTVPFWSALVKLEISYFFIFLFVFIYFPLNGQVTSYYEIPFCHMHINLN